MPLPTIRVGVPDPDRPTVTRQLSRLIPSQDRTTTRERSSRCATWQMYAPDSGARFAPMIEHGRSLMWAEAALRAGAGGGPDPRLPTGTVTFLLADIEDSTRLWSE